MSEKCPECGAELVEELVSVGFGCSIYPQKKYKCMNPNCKKFNNPQSD